MKSYTTFTLLLVLTFILSNNLNAQTPKGKLLNELDLDILDWYNKDFKIDKTYGISTEKAYELLLKDKKSQKKIIVAVIDGGVDTNHVDLKEKIWTNLHEIPGNGIDDDDNGYVDDIHGWNFIGNSNHENIKFENIEEVRIIRNLDPLFKDVKSLNEVHDTLKSQYVLYMDCQKSYKEMYEKYSKQKEDLDKFEVKLNDANSILRGHFNKDDFSLSEVRVINSYQENVMRARYFWITIHENGFSYNNLGDAKENYNKYLNKHLNFDFEPRIIIGDNTRDLSDNNYGNNDVKWTRSYHGTGVAGIIAAVRNNGIGINGIADNVEIMALRTVPIGDERDKDIALSIYYAVDNGANIINMSFGKNRSPEKVFVDKALQYAVNHNVLVIHASGNDGMNIDETYRYPSDRMINDSIIQGIINIGASSIKLNKNLCGRFSNYGYESVDLFAPGVDVLTLFPEDKYFIASGTSFASPVVTGLAALVWSYYPELTALELKQVILDSSLKYPKKRVYVPNIKSSKRKKKRFRELSQTGGIANVYEALLLAEQITKAKETVRQQ